MWFEQIVREETGCATYLIGSTADGRCVVVDPLWAVEPYEELARKRDARIAAVIDTHSHADHVSGARRLAARCGAELMLPERAEVEYPARRLADGERLRFGELDLEIVPAPGHRPEQIVILVRDRSRGPEPWFALTADSLLVGDFARPDLAQDGADGATTLYDVTIPRLFGLPDHVEVYPGHVSGST